MWLRKAPPPLWPLAAAWWMKSVTSSCVCQTPLRAKPKGAWGCWVSIAYFFLTVAMGTAPTCRCFWPGIRGWKALHHSANVYRQEVTRFCSLITSSLTSCSPVKLFTWTFTFICNSTYSNSSGEKPGKSPSSPPGGQNTWVSSIDLEVHDRSTALCSPQ